MRIKQKTEQSGYLCENRVELEANTGAQSIVNLGNEVEDGAGNCAQFAEPPYTERYVRWCERSATQLMGSLLLDKQGVAQTGV